MSKPDKPIFNQQGGRGKLYGPTHGATYMGTYQMPDGKMDRRMFNCATNKDAIKAYTDWCADMDARILEEMEEKVRPKAKAQQPKEKPAYTEPFKKDEVKGADMATTADAKLDKIYVVMVVGGVAVACREVERFHLFRCEAAVGETQHRLRVHTESEAGAHGLHDRHGTGWVA